MYYMLELDSILFQRVQSVYFKPSRHSSLVKGLSGTDFSFPTIKTTHYCTETHNNCTELSINRLSSWFKYQSKSACDFVMGCSGLFRVHGWMQSSFQCYSSSAAYCAFFHGLMAIMQFIVSLFQFRMQFVQVFLCSM